MRRSGFVNEHSAGVASSGTEQSHLPANPSTEIGRVFHKHSWQTVLSGLKGDPLVCLSLCNVLRLDAGWGSVGRRHGPIEWNDRIVVTGYWFLDSPPDWHPSDELVQFLGAGPPPVYIGFGSMSSVHPEHLSHLVQEALERSHQRGVLLTGWGALRQEPFSEQLYTVASIPHDWLFHQMAAVVHHGGAGTTGASLRAGVPSIIVSFLPEQAFWGAQVFQ